MGVLQLLPIVILAPLTAILSHTSRYASSSEEFSKQFLSLHGLLLDPATLGKMLESLQNSS